MNAQSNTTTSAEDRRVKVDFRAVLARLNRRLARDGRRLCRPRSERVRLDLGDVYLLDLNGNAVMERDVNVEQLARDLGVLRPFERIAEASV